MDAQLLISDIRAIRITAVRAPTRPEHGGQEFVRIVTVLYAGESEYEICLTADDARRLEISEEPAAS